MWKDGAALVNSLLWSFCGHWGWEPLEAHIVKMLQAWKKQYTVLICLKYFVTRKTKSIPVSLNEVIEYVPERSQSMYAVPSWQHPV